MMITDQPANAEILEYLKGRASPTILANIAPRSELAYTDHTHPELADLLRSVSESLPEHHTSYVYGFLVVANQQAVICAVAESMSTLAFRLPERLQLQAFQQGAKAMSSVGDGWVEFHAWKLRVSNLARIELFRSWCEKAYLHASKIVS